MNKLPHVCRPVIEYQCGACRCPHRAGFDKFYTPHLRKQTKPGTRERSPTPNEVLERLALEPAETPTV